ncbi:Sin-like protein conserved region-domain-containing protein [Haematococcus lacustris]
MAEDDEEEDAVVRELDVYVCNDGVGAQLCMLAHPLRPPWRPYDYERVDVVKMKPNARRMEVEVPLDTRSPNYHAEDDRLADGTPVANNYKRIDKLTLKSSCIESKTSLAIGTIQDGKLLLSPLDMILQLRPVLNNLAVGKKGRDASAAAAGEDDEEEAAAAEQKPSMKAVELQVQKRETERQQQQRLNSYAHISKQEEDEAWKTLKLHMPDSRPAEKVWGALMTPAESKPAHPHLPRPAYLKAILPPAASAQEGRGTGAGPGQAGGQVKAEAAPATPGVREVPEEVQAALAPALKLLMAKHSVCSLANIRTWLLDSRSKAGAAKAAANLPDNVLEELVTAAGLPLTRIRRMFVLREVGKADLDPFRAVVIDLLSEKESFKRAEVTEKANAQGIPVTDSLYSKVVKDICASKGQLWFLKNGTDTL